MKDKKRMALIILDGWGHGRDPEKSAIAQAKTPFIDSLYHILPNAELVTFGEEVGLPEGQMGNSEVGHLNIGAGRVVYQELARINKSIKEKELDKNPILLDAIQYAIKYKKTIHLVGLVSDGGVHSHINHVIGLCDILSKYPNLKVCIHAFLDGRDTDPMNGSGYLESLLDHIEGSNARIISVIGRYYAMDRDKRWERIARAYHLLVNGMGSEADDLVGAVKTYYSMNKTDEFMEPIILNDAGKDDLIKPRDVVLFFNFRTDRPRQLTETLIKTDFPYLDMKKMDLYFCTMTEYDKKFDHIHKLFEKDDLKNTLGEIISENGLTQVRIAETEKYPHVTYFFSGGRELEFQGESRILIHSPNVATYDLKPEMSAEEVTDALIENIRTSQPDFICLNYANTDMVGHTGVMAAAIRAAETVDSCLKKLVKELDNHHYYYLIIADHGNADVMINEDGTPNTAHTTNLVPVFAGGRDVTSYSHRVVNGKLSDIAPTILHLMGIKAPVEMTGNVLVLKK